MPRVAKTKRAGKTAMKAPVKTTRVRAAKKKAKAVDTRNLREKIEKKAYALYESRGQNHGDDQADWYEAEQIIKDGRGSIRIDL